LSALRRPDAKLIRHELTGESELYDLAADPGERANLASTLSALQPKLARAMAERQASAAAAPPSGAPNKPVAEPTADLQERLRALGYVQ
jgi:hypothetical protein